MKKPAQLFSTINLFFVAIILLLVPDTDILGQQPTRLIDDFSDGLSSKWQKQSFKGETNYQVKHADGRSSLEAISKNSASGLYYEIQYNPDNYPILTWNWKIENTLKNGDAKTKAGDDYPARIYVVFPGFFFWQTKALNYIWANKLPQGEFIKNSHTGNAVMVAVESGNTQAGQWRMETRNIVEDYRRAFGGDPPDVGSIAIMTDTDNTGEMARAWYGTIKISSESLPSK